MNPTTRAPNFALVVPDQRHSITIQSIFEDLRNARISSRADRNSYQSTFLSYERQRQYLEQNYDACSDILNLQVNFCILTQALIQLRIELPDAGIPPIHREEQRNKCFIRLCIVANKATIQDFIQSFKVYKARRQNQNMRIDITDETLEAYSKQALREYLNNKMEDCQRILGSIYSESNQIQYIAFCQMNHYGFIFVYKKAGTNHLLYKTYKQSVYTEDTHPDHIHNSNIPEGYPDTLTGNEQTTNENENQANDEGKLLDSEFGYDESKYPVFDFESEQFDLFNSDY